MVLREGRSLAELPTPVEFDVARAALVDHRDKALDGLRWEEEGPLALLVWLPAEGTAGNVDEYLARFTFLYYPKYPPSVTFLNPKTRQYDGSHWPKVAGLSRIAFSPRYPGTQCGLVCNSMVFEWYFWGGHDPQNDTITWKQGYTFAATIAEIRDALRPPYYRGVQ